MRTFIVAVAIAATTASSMALAKTEHHPPTPPRCTAKAFRGFAERVWRTSAWHRGAPPAKVIAAQRRRIACAGPENRRAMQRTWHRLQRRYFDERHRCRGGTVVVGRVSYFGGGLMASGHYTSEPAIALNISPGSESGWNNSITRGWLASLQRFRVTIAGHTAVLFLGDLGPAGFTQRAIDVTEGGVAALGLSGAFPTDSIGRAKLIPPAC